MTSKTVAELLSQDGTLQDVTVKGWVRTFRANRFIALNDGSTINNIQCVVDPSFKAINRFALKVLTHPFTVTSCKVPSCDNNSATVFEVIF